MTFIRAALAPETFDETAQTIEAIASTFADVQRRDGRGLYLERLDPVGLDMTSIEGVPLLDGHRQGSARDVLGIVKAARIEGAQLVVTLRLSQAADAAPAITRIREGLVRVSIGYSVLRWSESADPKSKERIRTAAAWRILEVSAVPVPADRGAQFRSDPMENEMPIELQQQIRSLAELAGLTRAWAADQIDSGAALEDARSAALAEMRGRQQTPTIRVATPAAADGVQIAARAADALAFRMGALAELPETSREFQHMGFRDIAVDALSRAGISVRGMSPDEIFHRAHTSSDFALVVSNAAGKSAAAGYVAAQSALKGLCAAKQLSNFKTASAIRLGEFGRLEPLSESGEFTAATRVENGETLSLTTFGRRFDVSRQLLINDDLGLFGDITRALGEAAAQTEAEKIVELLTGNAALADGLPLFHASRGNVADGTSLDETGAAAVVAAARTTMRKTKGLDGKTIIDASPKYLIVGPDSEFAAEELLAEIFPTMTAEANLLRSKFELVVEPRIDGKAWFLLADPTRVPVMNIAYLAGAPGVQIQRNESWDTLGTSYRAYLDFGTGYAGWRGAFSGGVE